MRQTFDTSYQTGQYIFLSLVVWCVPLLVGVKSEQP